MTNLSKRILFKSRILGVNEEYKIFDFYPTPKWGTNLMLDTLKLDIKTVLEPCNGMGSISDVLIEKGYKVTRFDINQEAQADKYLDFLKYKGEEKYDAIITNPPFKFNYKWEFAKKSFEVIKDGGYVIMVSQITMIEGQKRKLFYDEFPPYLIYVHSKRYSIRGKSGIGYAWFIWKKGYKGETKIKII